MCKRKSCKYAPHLRRYLARLTEAGERLPDSDQAPGIPNLSAIAKQAGIEYRHLRNTAELRQQLDQAARELGVGRRPLGIRELDLRREVTYADLLDAADDSGVSSAGRTGRYRSALMRFMEHHGRLPQDAVGPELSDLEGAGIDAFLGARSGASPKVDRSAIRYWQRLWSATSSLEHLPSDFNEALALLAEAAGVSVADLARATGIDRKLLWEYLHRGKRPLRSPQHVARLEEYFGLPEHSLADMLPHFSGPSRRASEQDPLKGLYPVVAERVRAALPKNFPLLSSRRQRAVVEEVLRRVLRQPEPQQYVKLAAARCRTPYCLHIRDWPPHLVREFETLVSSVGAPILKHVPTRAVLKTAKERGTKSTAAPTGFEGHRRVRGMAKRWSKNTVRVYREFLGSYFGYLLLHDGEAVMPPFERPKGQEDYRARRFGLDPEELTLGLLAVDELLMEFIAFRFFERGVGYNKSTLHLLSLTRGLIRPKHGWVRYQPDIAQRAERVCLSRGLASHHDSPPSLEELCDECIESIEATNTAILEETPNVATDLVARDVFAPILPILNEPSPRGVLEAMLEAARRDLPAGRRRDGAIAWRDFVYVRLLAETALRGHHFPDLRWGSVPGHAHLRLETIDGQHRMILRVPRPHFKNSATLPNRGDYERILPHDLTNDLLTYIEEMRPILDPSGSARHLFLTDQGAPLKDKSLRKRFRAFTERYLSPYSPVGLQLDGVQPFGPHLVRHIRAVDKYLETGSYRAVADLLLNTERVAKRVYAVLNLSQRVELASQEAQADVA